MAPRGMGGSKLCTRQAAQTQHAIVHVKLEPGAQRASELDEPSRQVQQNSHNKGEPVHKRPKLDHLYQTVNYDIGTIRDICQPKPSKRESAVLYGNGRKYTNRQALNLLPLKIPLPPVYLRPKTIAKYKSDSDKASFMLSISAGM